MEVWSRSKRRWAVRLTCTELEGRPLGCALGPVPEPARCEPRAHGVWRGRRRASGTRLDS